MKFLMIAIATMFIVSCAEDCPTELENKVEKTEKPEYPKRLEYLGVDATINWLREENGMKPLNFTEELYFYEGLYSNIIYENYIETGELSYNFCTTLGDVYRDYCNEKVYMNLKSYDEDLNIIDQIVYIFSRENNDLGAMLNVPDFAKGKNVYLRIYQEENKEPNFSGEMVFSVYLVVHSDF